MEGEWSMNLSDLPWSPDTFWKRVEKTATCWLWTGARGLSGYGVLWSAGGKQNRKQLYAHRVAYFLHNNTLPDDLCICHTCDNPPCVNPAHLFLGDHKQNALDKVSKGRQSCLKGEASGRAVLTEAQVLAIRSQYSAGGITQAALGAAYGVTRGNIASIVRQESWRHI